MKLIEKIVREWSYRIADSCPNPKNTSHLAELSTLLSEMGLDNIKHELIQNLTEADNTKRFRTPELNKTIKYRDKHGKEKSGMVGDLLRLAADQPGRIAAEKGLPADGSPERDAMNKDLGSEKGGHSTTPEPKKEKVPGEPTDNGQPTPDPKAMFTSDPTMQASLDREKKISAQLAADAQPSKDTVKDQIAASKKKVGNDFNPVKTIDLTNKLPHANKDTFNNKSDINNIPDTQKMEISTKIDELAKMAAEAKAKGEKAPNFNLCKISVPGTNLYCDGNLGIPREEMPQFKGKPQPGTKAAKMKLDANGEVDTEPMFRALLKNRKVKIVDTIIPSDRLKATQSELVGAKVAGMAKALDKDPNHPAITAPIYVSRDGYVVDGHHRWAAITSKAIADGMPADMKVHVIDMDAKDIIPLANKFAEYVGVAAKKADTSKKDI